MPRCRFRWRALFFDGVLYYNDGDWVESCTALVEYRNGALEILDWADVRQLSLALR